MTSKAESITQAVVAALTVPAMTSVPAARVFRDINDALASDQWPAVAVETGEEQEPVRPVIGYKLRTAEVRVTVLASGTNAFTSADAALVESFNRLSANPTLGGLAFEFNEGVTDRSREGAAQNVAAVTKSYLYQFRTTESSLES